MKGYCAGSVLGPTVLANSFLHPLELRASVESDLVTRTGYGIARPNVKGKCRAPCLKIIKDFKAVATEH